MTDLFPAGFERLALFAFTVRDLPAVNATLNATATVLLLAGYVLIKTRRERAHKWAMLSAFGVSIVFLVCYLVYHAYALHVKFTGPTVARYVYYAILIPHVVLAAAVPVFALFMIYTGFTDRRERHRRIGRYAFPIWLFVSVTGVIVYVMLYHLYPAPVSAV